MLTGRRDQVRPTGHQDNRHEASSVLRGPPAMNVGASYILITRRIEAEWDYLSAQVDIFIIEKHCLKTLHHPNSFSAPAVQY